MFYWMRIYLARHLFFFKLPSRKRMETQRIVPTTWDLYQEKAVRKKFEILCIKNLMRHTLIWLVLFLLKQNCTLEGIALVTTTFGDENEWRPLYYNSTDDVQHLRYSEKNHNERVYGKEKPWKGLNLTNFINNATAHWSRNLTTGPINAKTQVGCYFDVDHNNYTLVCAFA
ncbi:hypothetical protein ANCCAN_07164 [Ancylostoma caninum]|uniref:Uncharacterized protein n=1 Tax=Ancylostoma caninum TaxID=29170 RepID=A0A368GV23_ANCCA|nr:hypothetical protein ANCCAN_07164 [Ancylostoma caninum]